MERYCRSLDLTIGLEVELQIINPKTQYLSSCAKQLIRSIQDNSFKTQIKPEITQSMIEINSSVHHTSHLLHREMLEICQYLKRMTDKLNVVVCGGGTHPFQNWATGKIFPTNRFRGLLRQYGYLAKRFTTFSMHVHVGCNNPDKAVYLTHMFSRFVPQLIALSASSPFYNGVKTGYDSTRVNIVNSFPLSGHMPASVNNWSDFYAYYKKMHKLKIIGGIKDLYWDIRLKPEYGTIEIRICDMPLSLLKAVALTAYIQTLASYLTKKTTYQPHADLYQFYDYNRFQASRFGYDGILIDPFTLEKTTIQQDVLNTLKMITPYAKKLGTHAYLKILNTMAKQKNNDAGHLKTQYTVRNSHTDIIREKCKIWKESLSYY